MAGLRIVIELRRDVNPEVILNMLYKYTPLQSSYGMNMVCIVDNRPVNITLHDALDVYLKHQLNVITRRTQYDLDKALDRIHILDGLLIAQDNIDEVIHLIRNTKDGTEKEKLMNRFNLDDAQAQAILDMRLQRISGLNYTKLVEERDSLLKAADEYREILASPEKKNELLISEMEEIRNKYADQRLSELALNTALNISNEDLIEKEDVIVTLTTKGYVKRMKQSEYRAQSRGGVGVSGMKTHADDDVNMIIPTFTHNYLMFFTNKGRVYSMKAYNIPEGSRTAKGTPIVNLLPLQENEHVQTITQVEEINDDLYLFFVTKRGTVKRTQMKEFANIRSTGIIAITLDEDDELFRVYLIKGNESIVLGASNGKAIRFAAEEIRSIGRSGAGVRGMLLGKEDEIVGCAIVKSEEDSILVVSQKGYGKRTAADEYRLQGRGGSGVKTMNVTEKNGNLVCLAGVTEDDDLIITTDRGVVIRMHCDTISQTKRATQGVKLISIRDNQAISTIAVVEKEDEELEEIENTEEVVTEVLDNNQENLEPSE